MGRAPPDEITDQLTRYFAARADIAWARMEVQGPRGAPAVHLIVAPREDHWSRLEEVPLQAELETLLGCWVFVSDERARFFRSREDVAAWKLIKDGDVARRLAVENLYVGESIWRECRFSASWVHEPGEFCRGMGPPLT